MVSGLCIADLRLFCNLPLICIGIKAITAELWKRFRWVEFFIVQCPMCKLVWRNPIPDPEFLNDLYSEKYFNVAEHSSSLVYQVGIADTEMADQNRRRDLTRREVRQWQARGLSPKNEFGEPRRLLEIGGGRGYLQLAAAELGWNTLGLEISPHGIKSAIDKGLMIIPVTLDELSEKFVPYRRYFDVVVFFDFLEHVPDPGKVLRMVRTVLKDDGTIIMRVPADYDDPALHLIDHVWHFSQDTIQMLLEREGFGEIEVQNSGVFRNLSGKSIQNLTVFATKRMTA